MKAHARWPEAALIESLQLQVLELNQHLAEVDGRLAAAAPELLAVCEELVGEVSLMAATAESNNERGASGLWAKVERARSAIAKARGR